jgi:hypothetical protein
MTAAGVNDSDNKLSDGAAKDAMPAEGTIAYKPVDHITPWESNPNL